MKLELAAPEFAAECDTAYSYETRLLGLVGDQQSAIGEALEVRRVQMSVVPFLGQEIPRRVIRLDTNDRGYLVRTIVFTIL